MPSQSSVYTRFAVEIKQLVHPVLHRFAAAWLRHSQAASVETFVVARRQALHRMHPENVDIRALVDALLNTFREPFRFVDPVAQCAVEVPALNTRMPDCAYSWLHLLQTFLTKVLAHDHRPRRYEDVAYEVDAIARLVRRFSTATRRDREGERIAQHIEAVFARDFAPSPPMVALSDSDDDVEAGDDDGDDDGGRMGAADELALRVQPGDVDDVLDVDEPMSRRLAAESGAAFTVGSAPDGASFAAAAPPFVPSLPLHGLHQRTPSTGSAPGAFLTASAAAAAAAVAAASVAAPATRVRATSSPAAPQPQPRALETLASALNAPSHMRRAVPAAAVDDAAGAAAPRFDARQASPRVDASLDMTMFERLAVQVVQSPAHPMSPAPAPAPSQQTAAAAAADDAAVAADDERRAIPIRASTDDFFALRFDTQRTAFSPPRATTTTMTTTTTTTATPMSAIAADAWSRADVTPLSAAPATATATTTATRARGESSASWSSASETELPSPDAMASRYGFRDAPYDAAFESDELEFASAFSSTSSAAARQPQLQPQRVPTPDEASLSNGAAAFFAPYAALPFGSPQHATARPAALSATAPAWQQAYEFEPQPHARAHAHAHGHGSRMLPYDSAAAQYYDAANDNNNNDDAAAPEQVCTFFLMNACNKAETQCPYRHDVRVREEFVHRLRVRGLQPNAVCRYFLFGVCHNGAACKYPHEQAARDVLLTLRKEYASGTLRLSPGAARGPAAMRQLFSPPASDEQQLGSGHTDEMLPAPVMMRRSRARGSRGARHSSTTPPPSERSSSSASGDSSVSSKAAAAAAAAAVASSASFAPSPRSPRVGTASSSAQASLMRLH